MTSSVARLGQQSSTVYAAPRVACDKKTEEDALAMIRSGDEKTVIAGLSSPCAPVAELIKLLEERRWPDNRDGLTEAASMNLRVRILTEAEAVMCIHSNGDDNIKRIGLSSPSAPVAELMRVLKERHWPYLNDWLTGPASRNLMGRDMTKAELIRYVTGGDLSVVSEGIEKMRKKDYTGAEASFTLAISLDPKNAIAYINRGIARINRGDFKGAIKDLDHVIKRLELGNALAFLFRAIAKYRAGHRFTGVLDFLKADKLDGGEVALVIDREAKKLDLKGYIQPKPENLSKYRMDDIEAYFTKRISREGGRTDLYILRGLARVMDYDVTGAFKDYQYANNVNSDGANRFIDSLLAKIDLEPYLTTEQALWDEFMERRKE